MKSPFVRRWCGTLALCLLLIVPVQAQETEQYKRLGRDALAQVVDGDLEGARRSVESILEDYPDDPEALFVRTVIDAQAGDTVLALMSAQEAVAAGLPFPRLLAGPRELLEPLTSSPAFESWAAELDVPLIHGPLLGDVTSYSARFWVRTYREVPIEIILYELQMPESDSLAQMEAPAPDSMATDSLAMADSMVQHVEVQTLSPMEIAGLEVNEDAPARRAFAVWTDADQDYTALLQVRLLKPSTYYRYQIIINNEPWPEEWTFRTAPAPEQSSAFSVAFGGGAGYTPEYERIWRTIASRNPQALLLLGDNVYHDNPERPAVQRYVYYRRQSRFEFQTLTAATPVYAVWDDHDFTIDDGWGGPEIEEPAWKRDVWNIFRENWNNPGYGGGEIQPGAWFSFSIGDVDVFMLDSRYYRENPNPPDSTMTDSTMTDSLATDAEPVSMLGEAQKAWLTDALQRSNATFKVIASPVPWAEGTKPGSFDTWDGFPEEREELFSLIEQARINGVVLLSADRHRADVWKIERPNGYDLYDFENSKLSNVHTHNTMPEAEFSYNEKNMFGLLSFDTTRPDPAVTYRIISIDDEVVHTKTLTLSELSHSE